MTEPDLAVTEGGEWQKLDARMLLVDPVKTLGKFAFPAIVGLIGIGSREPTWTLLALPVIVAGAVLIGIIPWLTTRYRITVTQLQVRRGLLNKTALTAPLDRVRSVDLEASLMHRLLGLTKVQIGTGVDDTRIELDALALPQADELRQFLLARRAVVSAPAVEADAPVTASAVVPEPTELARIDWSWLRFAPFSLSRLVIVAGALGALSQFGENLPIFDEDTLSSTWDWIVAQALFLVLVVGIVGALVAWVIIAVLGYIVQWWNLRFVRDDGTLRLTAGLFTTRSTTVEEARVRGVELSETALLRLVGGAELRTLATGVGSGGVTKVLPPCPLPVAKRVGNAVLETTGPLDVRLQEHGPAARRRCHVRAQWVTVFVTAAVLAAVVFLDWPVWLPVVVALVVAAASAGLGELEYRHLGHALTTDHLVSGTGALQRNRTVLERDGIIGWVVHQSFFQRRLGLASLVATTAAGPERVGVSDLPYDVAVALADAATPGVLTEFLEHAGS